MQVDEVDARPDGGRGRGRLGIRQLRIAMEIRLRIGERGAAQRQEAIDVPVQQHVLAGVEIDREVEEIRHVGDRLAVPRRRSGLQHVEALNDQNVRLLDLDPLVRLHVGDQVRVDRRAHRPPPGLHLGEEAQQRRQVVALGEALALHQAFALEHRVGIEEAVGGDEIDARGVGPARQQRLQHARGGRLADRDRTRDPDDVGHLRVLGAEEVLLHPEQPLGRHHVEREQARQRQIDLLDLLHVEPVVERTHLADLGRRQGHRRVGAQRRPFGPRKGAVGRQDLVGALLHRRFALSHRPCARPSRRGPIGWCGGPARPRHRRA